MLPLKQPWGLVFGIFVSSCPAPRVAYDHFLVEAVVQHQAVRERQAMRLHGVPRAWNGTARGLTGPQGHNGRSRRPPGTTIRCSSERGRG